MGDPREATRVGPATEQSKNELALAKQLREDLDVLLNGQSSIFFDLGGQRKFLIEGETSGWRQGSLLDSPRWPNPFPADSSPGSVYVSKFGNVYEIKIKDGDYGIRFTLEGNHPKIDEIVPEGSPRVKNVEQARSWKEHYFPAMHGRFGCLRPRIKRLDYGLFLAGRISDASLGKPLLRK